MKLKLLIVLIVFLAIIKPVIADQVNADNSTVRTLDKSDNKAEMKFPGSGSTKETTTITEPPEDTGTTTTGETEDTSDTTKPYGKNLVPEGSTVKCSFTGPGGNELITWITPCGIEFTTSSLNGPVKLYNGVCCEPKLAPLAPLTPNRKIKEVKYEETDDRTWVRTKYEDGEQVDEIWYKDDTYEKMTISADRKTITEQDKQGFKYETKIKEDGSREGPELIGSVSCHPRKPSRTELGILGVPGN